MLGYPQARPAIHREDAMPLPQRRKRPAAAGKNPKLLQDRLRRMRAELRRLKARAATLAATPQRDALTDTPNRTLMLDRLQSALTMAQRHGGRAAVLFLDVDQFKHINDTLGHAAGDSVLQMVAHRLQAAVRDSDAVGRHGGDEFLVLLPEVARIQDVALIAHKIIADVAETHAVDGQVLQVSVSVGIAVYPSDGHDAHTLIGLADAAMYAAKRSGGGCYRFHAAPRAAIDRVDLPD